MKSYFSELIKKYLPKTAKYFYDKINGSKEEPKYLHDQMLDEEFSDDMNYASISGNFTRITADVVAFDSPMPLKSRSVISTATGSIPKIGLKYILNEKQMNTLINLSNREGRIKELIKKIFNDTENCILGIKEKIEQIHLIGFSSGMTIIKTEENTGTGIRINYNIPNSNKFGAVTKWDDSEAKPIDDIRRILKAAKDKGERPNTIWMDGFGVDRLLNNQQVKEMFAFTLNFQGDNVPMLSEDQLTSLFRTTLKLNLKVVDRSFTIEKDGKRSVVQGWTENMVVFTTGVKVGSLVYSTSAEAHFKQKDVEYAEPNSYILISKSGTTDPVSEKTVGQALVVPVLQNVESIFYLNSAEAQEVDASEVEDDATITIWETSLTKATVIEKYNEVTGKSVGSSIKDATLIGYINKLSDEDEASLKIALGL